MVDLHNIFHVVTDTCIHLLYFPISLPQSLALCFQALIVPSVHDVTLSYVCIEIAQITPVRMANAVKAGADTRLQDVKVEEMLNIMGLYTSQPLWETAHGFTEEPLSTTIPSNPTMVHSSETRVTFTCVVTVLPGSAAQHA